MLKVILNWQYIVLFITGALLSWFNTIGIKHTIIYVLKFPDKGKGIVTISFLIRGLITAGFLVILMDRDYRRAIAVLGGFTLAKIADIIYFKLHKGGEKIVAQIQTPNTVNSNNHVSSQDRSANSGGKHEL